MSNAKRSRAASNVVPLAAGKKDHTTPAKFAPPTPAPLIACLKVKVILGKDARGDDRPPLWVEAANYPADGGLEAFFDLIHRAPDDCFMSADARGCIAFASIVAIRRPKDPCDEFPVKADVSPPGAPRRLYRRLRVPIGSGRQEIVEVANVPWTENGIAHFGTVVGKHRRCDFLTEDYGFVPARAVRLEDLKMPGEPPAPRHERLRPEDILRPEDLPE